MLVIGLYSSSDDLDESAHRNYRFMILHIVTTTLAMAFMIAIVCKNPSMIEFAGTSFAGSGCILMAICNLTSLVEVDDVLNFQELSLTVIYYLLYTGVLTTQFMWHMPIRVFWYAASFAIVTNQRMSSG